MTCKYVFLNNLTYDSIILNIVGILRAFGHDLYLGTSLFDYILKSILISKMMFSKGC